MRKISYNMAHLPESGIRKVQMLAATKPGCIRLETGEPNFVTPDNICHAATKAMADGMTKYTPLPGYPSLRKALAKEYSDRLGQAIDFNDILITTGAAMALYNAMAVIADPGDEILIPDPCWPVYRMQCCALGIVPVPYTLEESQAMQPTRENLERQITEKTQAILLNSPSNPVGVVFSKETIAMILDVAREHDLYVISDEVYDYLTYDGCKFVSAKAMDTDNRVILIGAASKKYAMTGWRVGFAIGDTEVIRLMGQLMIGNGGNCCSISQKAYEAALTGPQDFVTESIQSYDERRKACMAICDSYSIPYFVPQGAFYLWFDISATGMDSDAFSMALFQEKEVAVAPGMTFGETGRYKIRISYGTEMEQLKEGMLRIGEFYRQKATR